MNIPVRMIGIATTIFWIFLIIFSISAAYSVKDLQFNFGEPQISITPDNEMLFSLPINIANKGYYNIGFFNVTTEISDKDGFTLARGSTLVPVIRKSESVTVFHNVSLNVDDLLQRNHNYLFNDTELNVAESVGMRIAEVIPVQAFGNVSFPWGAPLYNFALGMPTSLPTFDPTHVRVTVPISFENHAFFDLVGNFTIRMYNSNNVLVGSSLSTIQAPQHSPYNGNIEFDVTANQLTRNGHFEVYFATPLFNYGPLVIPYG